MVRQLFNRLVWHSRDYDMVVEHAFRCDAVYTFNSSHDMLSIGSTGQYLETVVAPTFIAKFYWVIYLVYPFGQEVDKVHIVCRIQI